MSNQRSLAGTALDYFHVCAFFNSKEEEYDVLCPFFREAVAQGEKNMQKNMHIVDSAFSREHRARLKAGGIDASTRPKSTRSCRETGSP
jgi:hypothetical protein